MTVLTSAVPLLWDLTLKLLTIAFLTNAVIILWRLLPLKRVTETVE